MNYCWEAPFDDLELISAPWSKGVLGTGAGARQHVAIASDIYDDHPYPETGMPGASQQCASGGGPPLWPVNITAEGL